MKISGVFYLWEKYLNEKIKKNKKIWSIMNAKMKIKLKEYEKFIIIKNRKKAI